MGSTGDVESGLRAALASAPLTDAALGDVITNVLSIIMHEMFSALHHCANRMSEALAS